MKRVLIITYYWPPAGGPGVQRWLKFVKYLPDFGVDPIVFIPENPHYPIQDNSLLNEVPDGIEIHRKPIFEPYRFAEILSTKKTKRISSGIIRTKNQSALEKAMLWIRGNFFIPDARKYWVKPSVSYLSELIEKQNIKTVITTGPPHSVHLIGQQLRQEHQVKWIADFRDPWTSIGYHKKLRLTKSSQNKHKTLERSVLNEADLLITTSDTTRKEFRTLTDKPIELITNGFDSDYIGGADLDDKFTIAHIGSLLTGRSPNNLWKVLSEIAREDEIFRKELQLEFIGVVSEDVMDNLYKNELAPYIQMKGYVSHAQALRRQQRAQILLLVEIDSEDTKGIVPGKLFEYMAARRPILALGPNNWEAGAIILKTHSGRVFDYQNNSQLKNVLLEWFAAYQQGKLNVVSKDVEKYSRKALTEQLSEYL
ncbi:glycosyltransferase family 4 protein [Ulvibacterium marinum]|uniref:Glycosyl transferase family 1 n=1 Tax=Ulvibacterium marinum TaxID=2419782 RepID=A0A3B0C9X3_9FLAO|nr:glycosyltransferase family 4 protein [Ulvibacterium marinum]RKN81418.1 glycosyl transferase family 1 [Ulvibacterium marinum]